MRPLFVTATGTGIGKTYTTLKLIELFGKQGVNIGAIKPIETGVARVPEDAKAMLEALAPLNPTFASTPDQLCAYTFELPAAPFCADKDRIIDSDRILEFIEAKKRQCDLLVIEGAGGLKVPITQHYRMIDLIKDTGAYALLVTPSYLGCINETELSMMALEWYGIEYDWCVNLFQDKESFERITRPYYDVVHPNWWKLQNHLDRFVRTYIKMTR